MSDQGRSWTPAPTPYRFVVRHPGTEHVIDHGPCEKEAIGNMCVDCWGPLPEGHDWPDVTPEAFR